MCCATSPAYFGTPGLLRAHSVTKTVKERQLRLHGPITLAGSHPVSVPDCCTQSYIPGNWRAAAAYCLCVPAADLNMSEHTVAWHRVCTTAPQHWHAPGSRVHTTACGHERGSPAACIYPQLIGTTCFMTGVHAFLGGQSNQNIGSGAVGQSRWGKELGLQPPHHAAPPDTQHTNVKRQQRGRSPGRRPCEAQCFRQSLGCVRQHHSPACMHVCGMTSTCVVHRAERDSKQGACTEGSHRSATTSVRPAYAALCRLVAPPAV